MISQCDSDANDDRYRGLITDAANVNKTIPGTELMPQSMTTAPGLTQSPFTNSGCPIATTRMSPSRT